jgi:hypothetical protein
MQVFTTHHWMVRIYKLKPQKNRIQGKLKLKSVSQTTLQFAYNHVPLNLEHIFPCFLTAEFKSKLNAQRGWQEEPMAIVE